MTHTRSAKPLDRIPLQKLNRSFSTTAERDNVTVQVFSHAIYDTGNRKKNSDYHVTSFTVCPKATLRKGKRSQIIY